MYLTWPLVTNKGYSIQQRRTPNTVSHMTWCRVDSLDCVWTTLSWQSWASQALPKPHWNRCSYPNTCLSMSTLWPRSHDFSAVQNWDYYWSTYTVCNVSHTWVCTFNAKQKQREWACELFWQKRLYPQNKVGNEHLLECNILPVNQMNRYVYQVLGISSGIKYP